jgi:hypothetical protein
MADPMLETNGFLQRVALIFPQFGDVLMGIYIYHQLNIVVGSEKGGYLSSWL